MSFNFSNELLALIPQLRSYAKTLVRDAALADDVLQDTLLSAWEKQQTLRDTAAIKPWMFCILRNCARQHFRRGRYEVEDAEGHFAATLICPESQSISHELGEVLQSFKKLPAELREPLYLVTIAQLEYSEVAALLGVPVGTVKSRTNRARSQLIEILSSDLGICEQHSSARLESLLVAVS